MIRRPKSRPRSQQPTPEVLLAQLLDFLQRKFYQGHPVNFAKDRRRLLDWVVLWPAKWLNERAVTIPPDRYREIFYCVFQNALAFGNTNGITYLPAYLAKVIQSHFAHHEEEIYQEGKNLRTMVEETLLATGKLVAERQPDPVLDLARAARLLAPKRHAVKAPQKAQLTLL